MGGRKGHSLNKVVGDTRKVRADKKDLLDGIKENNPKKVAKATAGMLSNSEKVLDSLTYSYFFADSIKRDRKKLGNERIKERKKELAKRWSSYKKRTGKKFDAETNREVVTSAARILGGKK